LRGWALLWAALLGRTALNLLAVATCSISSSIVPNSPQLGQRPKWRGVCRPQLVQTYLLRVFAMQLLSVGTFVLYIDYNKSTRFFLRRTGLGIVG
jgi:hypothetical protein